MSSQCWSAYIEVRLDPPREAIAIPSLDRQYNCTGLATQIECYFESIRYVYIARQSYTKN